jgi:hypothetical protein
MDGRHARVSVEAELSELRARRRPDEVSYFEWSRRINEELAAIARALSDEDARVLRARLSSPAEGDELAAWIATRNNSAALREELTDARRLQRRRERELATGRAGGR